MKLIKPNFEIWTQEGGLEGVYKQIERAGRVCYKSEDKITEDSAKEFVERMIKSGHGAMLEHGTVYLVVPYDYYHIGYEVSELAEFYETNPYSKINEPLEIDCGYPAQGECQGYYITTNYRVLVENDRLDDLKYICEPTEYHAKRITVKFTCDRGVSHEFVRHRVMSFAQESTRYCNYSKDKFGNEITLIYPNWFSKYFDDDYSNLNAMDWQLGLDVVCAETNWLYAMLYAEKAYFSSIANGMKPQQARAVLPNSLKTELVVTGFASDWGHFFELRDAGSAHPQARELAQPLHMEFLRRKYLVSLYDEANPD